jgi:hypothetical protein
MIFLKKTLFLFSLLLSIISSNSQTTSFIPGEIWKDNQGNPINAHGAGILFHNGTYYLYGEIKKGNTWLVPGQGWECYRVPAGGVSCYSSKDLLNWKNEGVVLPSTIGVPSLDTDTGNVIERPKVIYNLRTKKFVMWMHIDSKTYSYARSGVAVSDRPEGPFTYLSSVRPNGNMARDMTLFQDDDGRVYHFYSSEDNQTMRICLLADDYLSHTTKEKRILINESREAPSVFKHNNKYYLITSGTSGWSPNQATYAEADSIMGDWKQTGDPCKGPDGKITFHSQSTFVLPLKGKKNAFLFLADRWNKTNLEDSRYVWLPLLMTEKGPQIELKDKWDMSVFDQE